MRTDLPLAFLAQLTKRGRAPRQLLELYFDTGTVYLSDQTYGADLADSYEAVIEDWGTLEDTSNLQNVLNGTNSGTRQLSITVLNKGAIPFSSRFNSQAPENVKGRLYQWFEGIAKADKVLIDELVIQDPIEYSEDSILLKLDLVSSNQYANPYIGQLDSTENEFYGIVIGSVSNAPGTAYGTRPVVVLAGDLAEDAVTIPCTSSPATAGFTAPGSLMLDFEKISYTGISGNDFTGCSRGVSAGITYSAPMPHSDGQEIFKAGHEYLYSFGAGPLDAMGPVYVAGEIYTGAHTIYKDRNPVQVGFPDGDPFIKGTGASITKDVSSYGTVGAYGGNLYETNWSTLKTDCIFESVRGKYSIGNTLGSNTFYFYWSVAVPASITNFSEYVSGSIFVKGNAWSYDVPSGVLQTSKTKFNGTTLVTSGLNTGVYYGEATFDFGSWGDLTSSKLASNEYFSSGAAQAVYESGDFKCLTSSVSYKPYVKNYSTAITCDLSSGTGTTNPADAITMVLATMGIAGNIEQATFALARDWYDTNGYSFNGFIPGDMRCRDILTTMCQQCRSRLLYDGGVVKLKVREALKDKTVDKVFTKAQCRLKSISVVRQSVQDILNKITLRYSASDVLASFQSKVSVSDSTSQDKFGLQEVVWDFFLVDDVTMATDLADFYLAELKDPHAFITFTAYLEAFILEIDDVIALGTDFSGIKTFIGDVASISRRFGKGKTGDINLYNITIKSSDNTMVEGVLSDSINIADSVTGVLDPTGYGAGGYGAGGYGA